MGQGNKKGGSGSGQTPQVNVPQGLYQGAANESGLGQYASSVLNSVASMTNWASGLASGGSVAPIGTTQSTMSVSGPNVYYNGPKPWATSFDPTTGLVTYTNSGNPSQTFTESLSNPNAQFGNLPEATLQQWRNDYAQAQRGTPAGGGAGATGGGGGYSGMSSGVAGLPGSNIPATGGQSSLGPFLGSAWNAIQEEEKLPSQMTPVEQQTQQLSTEAQGEGSTLLTQGESMLNQATTGSGLFPSQQAYVQEAQQTGETGAAAELAKLGLSNSTMSPQLKEQADLSAAATAGTLVQGNIAAAQNQVALGQASQKLALAGQTLETGEQQAVFDMWQGIATESTAFQQNLWNEAMQGYGVLGSMISTAASSYGYSLQGYQSILQAGEANASAKLQEEQAAEQADSQSTAGIFGALGSILGSTGAAGGSGSGLLGALGTSAAGAVGSAGAASVGGGAAAAGGSGLLAGVGGALTALFCQVAQAVYGFDNPKWEQFRAWLLLRAPLWLVRLYGRHAGTVAEWLEDKPALKWIVARVMDTLATC